MHALHLPPRHLLSIALLALVLTAAVMALATGLSVVDLGASGGEPATSAAGDTSPAATTTETPAWIKDPMAPATLALER